MAGVMAAASPVGGPALGQDDVFGEVDASGRGFEGLIYAIPDNSSRLPDFRTLSPFGRVTTATLDVPSQSFDQGFPGVANRFEWFAIQYNGVFVLDAPARYDFRLLSDDGSRLIVDDQVVIDNDGVHAPSAREGSIALAAGLHCVRVDYFQGPRYHVALQLTARVEGGEFATFDLATLQPRYLPQVPLAGGGRLAWGPRTHLKPPFATPGVVRVTPEQAIEILRNQFSGRPPLDPAMGRGRASWFVTVGDPRVGPQAAAQARIPLRVTLDVPPDAMVIDGPRLEGVKRVYEPIVGGERLPRTDHLAKGARWQFVSGVERAAEARMWESLGNAAETAPGRTIRVELVDTALSKGRNGEYVVTSDPHRIRLETDPVRLHEQVTGTRGLTYLKYGGRVLLVAGAAYDGYRIYDAPAGARGRVASQVAGGWAGAFAVGHVAAGYAAPLLLLGPWGWVAYGAVVLGTGVLGYAAGAWAGDKIHELATTPPVADLTEPDTRCRPPR